MAELSKGDVQRFFAGSTVSPFPYPDDVALMGAALVDQAVQPDDVLVATRDVEGYPGFVMLTGSAVIGAHREGVFRKRLVTRSIALEGVDELVAEEKTITKFEGAPGGSITLGFHRSGQSVCALTWRWANTWEESQSAAPGKAESFARGEHARFAAAFRAAAG